MSSFLFSVVSPILLEATGGGLRGLYDELVSNWLGPIFLIVMAIVAIYFVKNRQFRELAAFIGICVIVALLIFFGDKLFGTGKGSGGTLTNAANKIVEQIH